MNDHREDPFDELMRRALSDEANRVDPADGLHEIQARVRSQRKPVTRRPWVITAGAAVVGTAAAIGAFAVFNDSLKTADEPIVAGGPSTTATTSASAEPSTSGTVSASPTVQPSQPTTMPPTTSGKVRAVEEPILKKPRAVPVYWLGRSPGVTKGPGYRLYRTFIQVKGQPARSAVELMTMPKTANDPDYESPWSGATVSSVRYTDSLILVDFKQLPDTQLEPDVADMAAQQLIYTVQGALQQAVPVQITEQGRSVSDLFGAIDTNKPLSRAKAADVQAFVWIETPENGQVVKQGFSVTGTAAAFEAHVDWKATNLKTKAVVKDYTNTKEGQKLSGYSFNPKLGAGEWLLEVYLSSAEDGSITDVDSKTIIVK